MRCNGVPPHYVKCFTEYLRAAGYYCTNNSKTDYQFDVPLTAWDESSVKAHWRNRGAGQPFFAVFNFMTTHESKVRDKSAELKKRLDSLTASERHDPAKAVLPPYYPDTPKVREDWAQYYDTITLMDKEFQAVLDELKAEGLADETIVFFWGDHGRGMPRAKRWLYDSGTRFPLIVHVPEKYKDLISKQGYAAGGADDELVGFIDLGPTVMSLAGVKIPEYIQGHAFLGPQKSKPREYIFSARDRMDEAYDCIRAVRDNRFKYIRNYMPHLPYAQDIDYMNQMPTMQEWRRLNAEGKLTGPQKLFFRESKPIEELYDCIEDPDEINNLAGDPLHQEVLKRLRGEHRKWMEETGDVGLIPEPEFDAMKWPKGKPETTALPYFINKGEKIEIGCLTPGASITYRMDDNFKAKTGWQLYTAPSERAGQTITAKACRIGFSGSKAATYRFGERSAAPQAGDAVSEWREELEKSGLLERLLMVRDLDFMGEDAFFGYMMALADPAASVRYWAIVGLHYNFNNEKYLAQTKAAIEPLFQDPSATVRIAAAHTMCDWGECQKALPIMVKELTNESDSVRLQAAIAIGRIGGKACGAIEAIKACQKDASNYVQRVTDYTLRRLEGC
jgi:uncharacterized sulfatase